MTDPYTFRLSEYLDGELSADERDAIDQHLGGCRACTATLEELRAVAARARALDDRPPGADLWTGIAGRIAAGRHPNREIDLGERRAVRRRFSFSLPQLLAAGIALMAVSAGTVRLLDRDRPGQRPVAVARPATTTPGEVRPVLETAQYDATIAALQRLVDRHRDRLDSSTVAAVQRSLRAVDQAIADAQAALAADPANVYLSTHLAETMRRKVQLLSRVAILADAAS